MAGFGQPFGAPGYRVIDSDQHINEPPDLWTSRVPAKFKDLVPRHVQLEQGDAWVMEGAPDPINYGLNAAAGLPVEDRRPWVRWEEIRPGGSEPKARLADMDTEKVDAAVMYPTPRISSLMFATKDPELHLAMVRAYNDWLSEFCGYDASRLAGAYIIPNRGIDQALAEIERMDGRPGMIAPMIGAYPTGSLDLTEDCDPVWRAITDRGLALHIHVSLGMSMPRDIHVGAATVTPASGCTPRSMSTTAEPKRPVLGGKSCLTPPTPHTPNASCADPRSRQRCLTPSGSTSPPRSRPRLNDPRRNLPQKG